MLILAMFSFGYILPCFQFSLLGNNVIVSFKNDSSTTLWLRVCKSVDNQAPDVSIYKILKHSSSKSFNLLDWHPGKIMGEAHYFISVFTEKNLTPCPGYALGSIALNYGHWINIRSSRYRHWDPYYKSYEYYLGNNRHNWDGKGGAVLICGFNESKGWEAHFAISPTQL